MNDTAQNEDIHLATHLYGYLLAIGIAGFGLFMVVVEPNVLSQFRFWISADTLNDLHLAWFAVCNITALYLFFLAILIHMFKREMRLSDFFWYYAILSMSLLFSTIFYGLVVGPKTTVFVAGIVILIVSNLITFLTTAVFFYLHFNDRHNFLPFALGICAITTAYTWFYLSFIGKITIA